MASTDEKPISIDEVAASLLSDDPHEPLEGMSYLIDGLFPADQFTDALRNLVGNDALAPFHMTVGEVASAILAANEIDEYDGDNEFVLDLIGMMQARAA